MDVKSLFNKKQFEPEKNQFLDFENYAVGINRSKEGWFLLFQETKDEGVELKSSGEYYQSGKSNSLVFAPALPQKPLVFKGSKLFVTPKQRVTFFLKIPLNIGVYYSKLQPENKLKEIVPVRLSDTWFGEPDLGEPAFSIGNEYWLNYEQIGTTNTEAICPVTIYNNSTIILEVERLIIRTDNLALYHYSKKNVTSVVEIEYKGKDSVSAVDYKYSKFYHGERQEILAKPRNTSGLNLIKKNFHFIKNIYRSE